MIEAVVRNIAAWMVYRDAIQYGGGVSRLQQNALSPQTGRARQRSRRDETLGAWCSFAARKALRRHKHTITVFGGGSGGQVVDQASVKNLLSTAISSIRGTVMGGNLYYLWTPPPTTVRWGIEASDAALKSQIKLTDLDELFGRIRKEKLQSFSTGRDRRMLLYTDPQAFFKSHKACYDYVKQRPTDRFLKSRKEATKYLEDIGLEFA
jgi:hypothetical protein